jgi:myosin heavy subunit
MWRVTSRALTDLIEESADPTSENYLKISASWELGFTNYHLVALPEGEKNIENGEFITDSEKIEELEPNLKTFGGEGKLDNGKYIYRQVVDEVVPLGIGLTESPAADVGGILASTDKKEDKPSKTKQTTENNSSQNNKKTVKNSKVMKKTIESTRDINDESLQELSASSITDFIHSELKKAEEQYKKEMTEAEDALNNAVNKAEALEKEQKTMADELTDMKSNLNELEKAKVEKEAEEKFNQRMSLMDEEYELSDEDRKVLASDIKDMEEEEFSGYQEKISILLKSKNKAALAELAKANEEEAAKAPKEEKEVAASEEEANEVVDEVLENVEATSEEVPVSSEADQTLLDKYASAFGLDQFDINTNRR